MIETAIIVSAIILFLIFVLLINVFNIPSIFIFTSLFCISLIIILIACIVLFNTVNSNIYTDMIILIENTLVIGGVTIVGIVISLLTYD